MSAAKKTARQALIDSKAQRLRREKIELDGIDIDLYARQLTAAEVTGITEAMPEDARKAVAKGDNDAAADAVAKGKGFGAIVPWIITSLVDEDGDQVFGDDDADLVMELFAVDQLTTLMRTVMELNAVSAEGMAATKND